MEYKDDILIELASISKIVSGIPNTNVFTTPEGYFEGVYLDFRKRLLLLDISNTDVPEGYFEQLSGNILNKIKLTNRENEVNLELVTLSPMVANIGNANVLAVPEGYFEANEAVLLKHAMPPLTPVVSMQAHSKMFRYMAAAAITGIIGLSLFGLLNSNEQKDNVQVAATVTLANEIIAKNSFEEEFAKISGEDIEQYLEERGQNVNIALAASTIEDKDLPDPLDYILDENALTDFLKQKNFSN